MPKVNRKFKDSLFRMVFQEKKELLSLYNAINESQYTNPDDLEINTLDDVIYMGMKNDLSFLFSYSLNLYEAQSSFNPNMPLRGVFYFSDLLKGYIEINHMDIYSETLLPLPTPQFVVFYNGLKIGPERKLLQLSNSYIKPAKEEPALECTALMLNINYGCNQELMERCKTLHDYSFFVEEVRKEIRNGHTLEEAAEHAIQVSLKEGILANFLRKNRAEVKRMVLTEYNEELHLKNVRECGYEDGLESGQQQLLLKQIISKVKKGQSLEIIADALESSPEQLQNIYQAVKNAAPDYNIDKITQMLNSPTL